MGVEAAQLLVDRGRSRCRFGNHRLGTQDQEQMPECCTQINAIPAHRPGAVTPRQMVVEKSPHQLFVDALCVSGKRA